MSVTDTQKYIPRLNYSLNNKLYLLTYRHEEI